MSASSSSPSRRSDSDRRTGRRIELWVRTDTAGADGVSHLVDQAESLARRGLVASVQVRVWDSCVDLSSTLRSHREREERARVHEFKRWAWEHGTELVGFGERRRAGRGRMGPEYITQRVPRVVLAEYEDEILVNVTPCRRSGCLSERLDELEAKLVEAQYSPIHSRIIR